METLSFRWRWRWFQIRSYRTYEEWKLLLSNTVLQSVANVLTVPMRNGNVTPNSLRFIAPNSFLPYLWGMETYVVHCFKQFLCQVLTVPMRNGNVGYRVRQQASLLVLTVPMRNGNFRLFAQLTAEPSVLTVPMRNGNPRTSPYVLSLRTVLTVPMRNGNIILISIFATWLGSSSYRTYEEWKPATNSGIPLSVITFLPYLWGMETQFMIECDETKRVRVLTVPMRNGNGSGGTVYVGTV